MASPNVDYTVRFRMLNMAQDSLQGILGQFSPIFAAMGSTVGNFTKNSGAAMASFGFVALGVIGGIMVAAKILSVVMDALAASFRFLANEVSQAVKIGTKFQNTITLVSVAAGQSADVFEELSLAASAVGISAPIAAKGLETMIRAGLSGSEAVTVFKDLALFSRAIGERMSSTASVMVGALRAFNLEAGESKRVLDVFAFAILKTRFNFATFSTAFAFAGAAAAGFGQKLEETVAVMSRLFNMGLRASTVGTTLRNVLTRLANPTRKAQVAMLKYGITLEQINPLQHGWTEMLINLRPLMGQLTDLTQIFGRRTAGFVSKLISQIDKGGRFIKDLEDKIRETSGLIEAVMLKRLGTAAGQLEVFTAQWDTARVELYRIIEPLIFDLFVDLNNAFESLREGMNNMSPEILRVGTALVSIVTRFAEWIPFLIKAAGAITALVISGASLGALIPIGNIIVNLTSSFKSFGEEIEAIDKNFRKFTAIANVFGNVMASILPGTGRDSLKTGKDLLELARVFGIVDEKMGLFGDAKRSGRAIRQLNLLRKSVTETLDKISSDFEKPRAGGEKQAAIIEQKAADMIHKSMELLKSEGGFFGGFSKNIVALSKKASTNFVKTFITTMERVFKDPGNKEEVRAAFKEFASVFQDEAKKRGPLMFGTSTDIKRAIDQVRVIGTQLAGELSISLSKNPTLIVDALLPSSATDKQIAAFKKSIAPLMKSIRDTITEEEMLSAGMGGQFSTLEENIGFYTKGIIENIKKMAKDSTKYFGPMENAVLKAKETMMSFGSIAVVNLAKQFKALNLVAKTKQATALAKAWNKWGKQGAVVVRSLRGLNNEIAKQKIKELFRMAKTGDLPAFKTMVRGAKDLIPGLKEMNKAFKKMTKNAQFFARLGMQAVNEQFKQLNLEGKYEEANRMAGVYNTWSKEIKQFNAGLAKIPSTFLKLLRLTEGQGLDKLLFPEDIDMVFTRAMSQWEKDLSRLPQIFQAQASLGEKYMNSFLFRLSKRTRDSMKILGTFMVSVMGSASRALIDDTFKFKDAFKTAINEMKAALLKLLILKPIFKAIFGGIFGGLFGEAGGLFVTSLLGGSAGIGGSLDGLSDEGRFTPPEFAGYAEGTSMMGSDREPALLSPGEIVFDSDASDQFRRLATSGGMGMGGITFNINAWDGADVERVVRRKIVPMLNNGLRNNKGISSNVVTRANRTNRRRTR